MLFGNQQKKISKVNIGDTVKIYGHTTTVSRIYFEQETSRTILELDWKEKGKSKVFLHDYNKIWFLVKNLN